jgi:hypothetical protein
MSVQVCLWILHFWILKKLEPPVDQSVAVGDVALALASARENPTNPSTPTMKNSSETTSEKTLASLNKDKTPYEEKTQTLETSITQTPTEKIPVTPDVSQNTPLNFGYLDMPTTPETKEPRL